MEESDEEVVLAQTVPVTKIHIDDDYLVSGHLDGSITLYGADRLNLISQINISPEAQYGQASPVLGHPRGNQNLYFRVSYIYRDRDYVISSMLDPTQLENQKKQLEVSIWSTKSQHSVQPLKSRVLQGHIKFFHYDRNSQSLLYVSHQMKGRDGDLQVGIEHSFNKWKLDTNSLALLLLGHHPYSIGHPSLFQANTASQVSWFVDCLCFGM